MENKMFCNQCQEATGCRGCTQMGVCGKTPEVAALQDFLIEVTKGLSEVTTRLRSEGNRVTQEINNLVRRNLFTTITNVNFDAQTIMEQIHLTIKVKEECIFSLQDKGQLTEAALWTETEENAIRKKAETIAVFAENAGETAVEAEDIRSLKQLILYGLKGLAAYMEHAAVLGMYNEELDTFLQSSLAQLLKQSMSVEALLQLTLATGEYGVKGMALLDQANTENFGNPQITKVNIGVGTKPGILISGHDLKDLQMLLEQTEGTGIDVYTHCEMLPAHYYPAFQKYDHFVGNYGNAWWKQKEEFAAFQGPILMTTNCLVPPEDNYKDRVYTTGVVAMPGCKYIKEAENGVKDFSALIEHAKKCAAPTPLEEGEIVGGFAHQQVLALADTVVEAVKSQAIKKFVVMAGCDGRAKSRDYYTKFAESLPEDTVILTAGCAKYRYNKLNLGEIGGIPRILDAGQCNDSYSLAVIALKLKEVFGLDDINELPIVYNISWYEQKAVIVLLALLFLGVKNIHLGPTLPAFLSPNVAHVLVEQFGLSGINTVEDDLKKLFVGKL